MRANDLRHCAGTFPLDSTRLYMVTTSDRQCLRSLRNEPTPASSRRRGPRLSGPNRNSNSAPQQHDLPRKPSAIDPRWYGSDSLGEHILRQRPSGSRGACGWAVLDMARPSQQRHLLQSRAWRDHVILGNANLVTDV